MRPLYPQRQTQKATLVRLRKNNEVTDFEKFCFISAGSWKWNDIFLQINPHLVAFEGEHQRKILTLTERNVEVEGCLRTLPAIENKSF